MKNNSLQYYENLKQFQSFFYSLDIYNNWKIRKGLLNERGRQIKDKRYVIQLKNKFANKKFFRKQVSIAEIVSWLDTMTLVNRVIINLEKQIDTKIFNQLKIYMEYMINMSKKMRVDYVIEYQDSIMLLEFRTVSSFEKIRPTWQNKFQELQIYKELMSYYIDDKKIFLYSFVALYEYDTNNPKIKNIEYNNNQIDYFVEYLKRYLLKKKSKTM